MKNCKKPRASKITTKPSLFSGKDAFSQDLFLRNEPNFNIAKLTATSRSTVVYNASHPKPQNGTNPNKANLKPILASVKSVERERHDGKANPNKANFLGLNHIFLPCELFKMITVNLYTTSNYIHQIKKLTDAPATAANFPEKFR